MDSAYCEARLHRVVALGVKGLEAGPAAKNAVTIARAVGALESRCCVVCGAVKTVGHHVDYSKPLLLLWLCHRCHLRVHLILEPRPPRHALVGRLARAEGFGATIMHLRTALGIGRDSLARQAGITTTSLWKIEKGHSNPSYLTLEKIGASLGQKLAYTIVPRRQPTIVPLSQLQYTVRVEIGQQIRNRRQELKLTPSEVAKGAQLTITGLRKIEAPGSDPKTSSVDRIGPVLRWKRVWIETKGDDNA